MHKILVHYSGRWSGVYECTGAVCVPASVRHYTGVDGPGWHCTHCVHSFPDTNHVRSAPQPAGHTLDMIPRTVGTVFHQLYTVHFSACCLWLHLYVLDASTLAAIMVKWRYIFICLKQQMQYYILHILSSLIENHPKSVLRLYPLKTGFILCKHAPCIWWSTGRCAL